MPDGRTDGREASSNEARPRRRVTGCGSRGGDSRRPRGYAADNDDERLARRPPRGPRDRMGPSARTDRPASAAAAALTVKEREHVARVSILVQFVSSVGVRSASNILSVLGLQYFSLSHSLSLSPAKLLDWL